MGDQLAEAANLIFERFPIIRYAARTRSDEYNQTNWVDVWDKAQNDFKYSRLRQLKNLSQYEVAVEVRNLNDDYATYINEIYEFLIE